MLSKKTFRFYNNYGRYMGNAYPHKANYLEFKNWLNSGNYILYRNLIIDISLTSENFSYDIFMDAKQSLERYNRDISTRQMKGY